MPKGIEINGAPKSEDEINVENPKMAITIPDITPLKDMETKNQIN